MAGNVSPSGGVRANARTVMDAEWWHRAPPKSLDAAARRPETEAVPEWLAMIAGLKDLLAVLDGINHRCPKCARHDDHMEHERPTLQDFAEALRARLTELEGR